MKSANHKIFKDKENNSTYFHKKIKISLKVFGLTFGMIETPLEK